MKQTKFAKALALSVGVLVFSGAISYLIFAWTAPSSPPPTPNVAAPLNTGPAAQRKQGAIGWGTTGAALNTDQGASIELRGNGTPYIDFSNDEAADYDARVILANNDLLTVSGADLNAADRLCIKGDCRTAWPGGIVASICPTKQWVIGIGADGKVICDGTSGFEPWAGKSCSDTNDTELRNANARRVFITNQPYTYYSVDTAGETDAICQNRAAQAGLNGAPYKALLVNRPPTDVLASGKTFWRCAMIDGNADWKQIAARPSDFATQDTSGNYLAYPIRHDQNGSDVGSVRVFSAYFPNGTGQWNGYGLCRGEGASGYSVIWGISSRKNIGWARDGSVLHSNFSGCRNRNEYLYCVDATP